MIASAPFLSLLNYVEVQLRLQSAWHQKVASHVAHRVDWVDVCATRRQLAKLPCLCKPCTG